MPRIVYALYDFQDNIGALLSREGKFNIRLVIDFIALFLQAFIFCALSVYQKDNLSFFILFAFLFAIDAIWFFIIIKNESYVQKQFSFLKPFSNSDARVNWMVSNFITSSILGLLVFTLDKNTCQNKWMWCTIVILINTVIDYCLNWDSYFPTTLKKPNSKNIFVRARFTSAITENGFDPSLKEIIKSTHKTLLSLGYNLFSAHNEERFGEQLEDPDVFIQRDLKQISESSRFIAVLDEPISSGLCVELGWASLMRIPIILIVKRPYNLKKHPMIRSLYNISPSMEVIKFQNIDELESELKKNLKHR